MRAALVAMMLMIASQAGAGETIRSALMLSSCRDININEVQEIDTENSQRAPGQISIKSDSVLTRN